MKNFGLYIFHYLGISSTSLFIAKPGLISPVSAYIISLAAGFFIADTLTIIISKIPFFRWAVLGIKKKP